MRSLLFILLLLPSLAFAQLHGEYCLIYTHYAYGCYKFLPQHKFKYEWDGCTGWSKGQGSYTLTDSTLVFHFEQETGTNNMMKIHTYQNDSERSDSGIVLYLYDNVDSQPLQGAHIYLNEDTNCIAVTEYKGQALLKVKNSDRNQIINIRYLGKDYSHTFRLEYNIQRLDMGLPIQPYRNPKRTATYLVGIVSRQLLELRSAGDKEFTVYKKKK